MAQFYSAKTKKSKSHRPNQKPQAVTVQHLSHLGEGMAEVNGKWVFIAGALPQEQIMIRLTDKVAGRQLAEVVDISTPSPYRQAPACPLYDRCGGCQLQHLQHHQQLQFKQSHTVRLLEKQGVAINDTQVIAPLTGPEYEYRRTAKLACHFDPKNRHLTIGFRQRNSKHIIQVESCAVLHPTLGALLPELHRVALTCNAVKFLGHIELLHAEEQSLPAVSFRFTQPIDSIDRERLMAFGANNNCHVFLHLGDNPIEQLTTATPIHNHAGYSLSFAPSDFFQTNGQVNAQLIQQVLRWLPEQTYSVIEWFAGKGNFTLPLAEQLKQRQGKLHAVELSSTMTAALKETLDQNGLDVVTVETADLTDIDYWKHWQQLEPTVALLDPPRDGAKQLCEAMHQLPSLECIIYISCNPNSFARDAYLLQQHGFTLTDMAIADMYPQSFHSESIARFKRNN